MPYGFAGTCVFDKQSVDVFYCDPDKSGQALFRSYGRCIAEFLNKGSLVHLRLLASPTCVGLRYGHHLVSPRGFSRSSRRFYWFRVTPLPASRACRLLWRICQPDTASRYTRITKSRRTFATTSPHRNQNGGAGILTCYPSTTPFGLALGPPHPGSICVAQETLGLRWTRFSLVFLLLMPTFALLYTPERVTSTPSQRTERSSTTSSCDKVHRFGIQL